MCAVDDRGAIEICLREKGALTKKRLGNTAVEQCSAISNRSIASALKRFKSGLCYLKLCITSGSTQKVL